VHLRLALALFPVKHSGKEKATIVSGFACLTIIIAKGLKP